MTYSFALTLWFLIPLALVLYQSKRNIAAKSNDECTEPELDGTHAQALSPDEIHAYYLSLYNKLEPHLLIISLS